MESDQSLAIAELYNMIFSFIKPMCLKCALDLGILHEIRNHSQPITLSQLHSALSIPQSKKNYLRRLMRILTHFGFVHEQVCVSAGSEATYDLTLVSRLLTNNEGSINLLPFTLFQFDFLENFLVKAYLCMGDWFKQKDKEKQLPFEMAHNCNFWEMTSQDSKFNEMFNDAMVSTCSIFTDVIIKRGGDIFKEVESLVDVGGGTGTMAKTIAMNFPHVQCTVLDLPHVVEGLSNDGIVKFVSGDMFSYIPPADAVLLKWVLHCWDDENCIKILKLCKEAIISTEGGKVIIMEAVIGSTSANLSEEPKLFFDMLMLTVTTGAERDEQEWKALFNGAGFSSYKIVHTIGFVSIMEVYP